MKSQQPTTTTTYVHERSACDEKKYQEELEKYDPAHVADLMYAKKERKIPGSVLKPHAPYVHLVQSNALRTSQKTVRVFFPYPQYCFRIQTQESFLKTIDLARVISQSDDL